MTSEELKALSKAATQGTWVLTEDDEGLFIEAANSFSVAAIVNGMKAEMFDANAALIPSLVNLYRAGLLVHRDDAPTLTMRDRMVRDGQLQRIRQKEYGPLLFSLTDKGRRMLHGDRE